MDFRTGAFFAFGGKVFGGLGGGGEEHVGGGFVVYPAALPVNVLGLEHSGGFGSDGVPQTPLVVGPFEGGAGGGLLVCRGRNDGSLRQERSEGVDGLGGLVGRLQVGIEA